METAQLKSVLSSPDKDTFRAFLDGAAAQPEKWVVSNRYPWQSKMAFEKLLCVAKETKADIRLLSGGGSESFYDDCFSKQLHACKDAGCKIQILIWQKSPDFVSKELAKLANTGTIQLRVSGTDDYADKIPHFLLVGDSAFRQEALHKPFDRDIKFSETEPQVPARIDFKDPVTGKTLLDMFSQLWGKT